MTIVGIITLLLGEILALELYYNFSVTLSSAGSDWVFELIDDSKRSFSYGPCYFKFSYFHWCLKAKGRPWSTQKPVLLDKRLVWTSEK